MDALPGRTAKDNRGFSVGVLSQNRAGQDRGDFGGACGRRQRGRRFEKWRRHGRVVGCHRKMATSVTIERLPDHPGVSSSYGRLRVIAGFAASFSRTMDMTNRVPFLRTADHKVFDTLNRP